MYLSILTTNDLTEMRKEIDPNICSFSLRIACAQYRGGRSVPWRDTMKTVGDIFCIVGDVQYRGGYHDMCGGYQMYLGGVQYHGRYHLLLFEYLHGAEHPPRYS